MYICVKTRRRCYPTVHLSSAHIESLCCERCAYPHCGKHLFVWPYKMFTLLKQNIIKDLGTDHMATVVTLLINKANITTEYTLYF